MTKTRSFFLAALMAAPFLMPTQAEASRNGDRYCREYTKTVRIGGDMQSAYGTACMQPDGSWQLVSFNGDDDLFDDIARSSRRGNGRVVRVERRPVDYHYPLYEHTYYYRPYYRPPASVFSFYWSDNDDRRDWRRDRRDHDRDRHHHRHGRNHDRD